MNHRTLRYAAGWEWHMLQMERPKPVWSKQTKPGSPEESSDDNTSLPKEEKHKSKSDFSSIKQQYPHCAKWLDDSRNKRENNTVITELPGGEPVIYGTLMVQVTEDEQDIHPLHFWLTGNLMITLQTDLRLSIRLQREPWEDKLERCLSAPEGFCILLNAVLESFHAAMDSFEKKLLFVQESMRFNNQPISVKTTIECRYELLHWNHLFIPLCELKDAIKEAFLSTLDQREEYIRLSHKLARIEQLVSRYMNELDTLGTMNEAFSNNRSGGVVRVLSTLITLITPATVAGILWGINYTRIRWLTHPLGFVFLCGIVVIFTLGVYMWLWRTGRTVRRLRGDRSGQPAADALPSQGIGGFRIGEQQDVLPNAAPLPSRMNRTKK
jgi:Mg2+ and Co2+ transporter CorA